MQATQHPAPALSGATASHLPFVYMPLAEVCGAVGFSTSRIYALIKVGEFPCGDLIGAQSRRWKSTDIAAWLIEQSKKSAQRQAEIGPKLKAKSEKAARTSAEKRSPAAEALATRRARAPSL